MENDNNNYFEESNQNLNIETEDNDKNIESNKNNNETDRKFLNRDNSLNQGYKSEKNLIENNLNESFVEYIIKDDKRKTNKELMNSLNNENDNNSNSNEMDQYNYDSNLENMGFIDKILQQRLYNYRPRINKSFVTAFIIPIVLFLLSMSIPELIFNTNKISINYSDCPIDNTCEYKFEINNIISGNVNVYYKIENFYINHRNYASSKDFYQLHGIERNTKQTYRCVNAQLNKDVVPISKDGNYYSIDNIKLDPDGIAYPCGFIAKSFLTDTFELYVNNNKRNLQEISNFNYDNIFNENLIDNWEKIEISEDNISDYYDKNYDFINSPKSKEIQWIDLKNGKKFYLFL